MCGVVGIYNHPEAANLAYLCLYALQHRGQESGGIVTSDGGELHSFRSMGLIPDIITPQVLETLPGKMAVGHVRYSTTGESRLQNVQPISMDFAGGQLALGHNGNLTNARILREMLEKSGSVFQSTMDTEVLLHLIAKSSKSHLPDRIAEALLQAVGAYCLVFVSKNQMIVARDPKGFRPLLLGKLDGGFVVVSESCALDLIGATLIREVDPGEMLIFQEGEMRSVRFALPEKRENRCIFEFIYFARPDSHIFGRDVYQMRKGFGRQLAKEQPAEGDVVIPVPDSGVPAAIGYSEVSGIPFQMGLIRNHYIGRTFIEPEQKIRDFGVKIKLNPVREVLNGKRVVVVDDSIVRGTTARKIVKMLREIGGAKEVHLRVSSPPTLGPCFYGMDTPTRKELIAANKSVEEIRQFVGADSLGYLSEAGLYWFEKGLAESFCDACFTGKYPTPVPDAHD